ncbi:hypothetical protein K438DRAFT_1822746 [Mycena galopus ATCC 62051]|nr:hypothetical protein K438DRAFT_1822746 [Mycena galopus ATCC 62051]
MNAVSPSNAFVFEPTRDPYYLDTVVFEVQHTLFKVPRFQFERHSGVFATTFSLPQPVAGVEGSSDKTPFRLDGIKRVDFQALLKVLYPLTSIPKTPTLCRDEWISVLKLANLWDFIDVRDLAIQQLALYSRSLDCVERIVFAREHDVSSWLESGYTELVRRKTIISPEEAKKIGWDVALQICKLREASVLTQLNENPYEKLELGDTFQAEIKRADSAHERLPKLAPVFTVKSAAADPGEATNPGIAASNPLFNLKGKEWTSAAGGIKATSRAHNSSSSFSFSSSAFSPAPAPGAPGTNTGANTASTTTSTTQRTGPSPFNISFGASRSAFGGVPPPTLATPVASASLSSSVAASPSVVGAGPPSGASTTAAAGGASGSSAASASASATISSAAATATSALAGPPST